MALYEVTIPKRAFGYRWTNVYHVEAGSGEDAIAVGEIIQNYEAAVHYEPVIIGPVSVRIPGTPGSGRKGTVQASATLDPAGLGGTLPLFCTVRVEFPPDEGTRAERKYLRLPGNQENTQDGGLWSGELVDFIQANYADALNALTSLRGPNNENLGSGFVLQAIQMRQLGWHRRTREGFHRGWVPD